MAVYAHAAPATAPPAAPAGSLQIYFIDVEGGQSTLFVAPGPHALLVDAGWDDHGSRDAERIVAAMKLAGIRRLDAVLLTHYHLDHVGGVPQLVARVPVGMLLDHGPSREEMTGEAAAARDAYLQLVASGRYKHQVMHVGERLPVPGFEATVVSADGNVLAQPLPGGGEANQFCGAPAPAADATENARSLGFALQWGPARILDLGDLTKDKERALECPRNNLGHVDLLVVSHHGWDQSSSEALVDAITPRVAVMDNGARKGGSTSVLRTFRMSPTPIALWQLHRSPNGLDAQLKEDLNTDPRKIANLDGTEQGPDGGFLLRATVSRVGRISVWNGRTHQTVSYPVAAGR